MGRKMRNARRRVSGRGFHGNCKFEIPESRHKLGRCAYCGRILGVAGWHYMRDEFGQRVRKCDNERECKKRRKDVAEEAYIAAVTRNAAGRYYWKELEENEQMD